VAFSPISRRQSHKTSISRPPTSGGRLVYAVGDIHGRADLLARLVEMISRDAAILAPERQPALVFLGDYVDRGDDSKAVVDQLIALKAAGRFEVRALKGNHERVLLDFLEDAAVGPAWEDFGGRQTLISYGVSALGARISAQAWEDVRLAFREALPKDHFAFLESLELTAEFGDYVFVHAGLRPGVALAEQREHDLLWIRDTFLQGQGFFDKVVVHGHTPSPEPYIGDFRIGIDTGAYATGVLTAVRLIDADQTILAASIRGG